jgi:drug/metabolite transporter (DMT)-like permease
MAGEIAALVAAGLWALATLLFGQLGKHLTPLLLNWVKGVMALGFLLLTLSVRSQITSLPSLDLSAANTIMLMLSGILGIGIGDTAFFASINQLGARRALLMETLVPPMAALLAWACLKESLSVQAWLGMVCTVAGVAWVITERVPSLVPATALNWQRGVILGLFAGLAQAVGAVLSRAALAETAIDPLWSTILRLTTGLLFITPAVWQPKVRAGLVGLKTKQVWGGVAIAAFLGTYLGIWLQQTALKYAPTGIAQSLLATSPIFVLPMSALLGERISPRAGLGAIIALGGVWILVMRTAHTGA